MTRTRVACRSTANQLAASMPRSRGLDPRLIRVASAATSQMSPLAPAASPLASIASGRMRSGMLDRRVLARFDAALANSRRRHRFRRWPVPGARAANARQPAAHIALGATAASRSRQRLAADRSPRWIFSHAVSTIHSACRTLSPRLENIGLSSRRGVSQHLVSDHGSPRALTRLSRRFERLTREWRQISDSSLGLSGTEGSRHTTQGLPETRHQLSLRI